ncbi:hypothetical protein GCM10023317_88120 [Actinopolymorpha pittospori]
MAWRDDHDQFLPRMREDPIGYVAASGPTGRTPSSLVPLDALHTSLRVLTRGRRGAVLRIGTGLSNLPAARVEDAVVMAM